MPTINQLIRKSREAVKSKTKSIILEKSPQKRGVCLAVTTTTPKKPNSAVRKIARVRLATVTKARYTSGHHHNLQDIAWCLSEAAGLGFAGRVHIRGT